MDAVHRCEYSNAVIGITEEMSPVPEYVPGSPGMSPLLLRFERRRREVVQADFHVFAATTGTSMCASRILAVITEASSVFPRIRSGCW
jgi:hypothetical protein